MMIHSRAQTDARDALHQCAVMTVRRFSLSLPALLRLPR